jgi:NAD(P)-dependent dehydrogenase (short-subunit alcohol dehydrogenase family)
VLGEAGATVYAVDRESRARRASALPGTAEDTAEQVDALGGQGIPVVLDHADPAAVAALCARVREEQGRLDLLVANAFAGNDLPFGPAPFWELPLDHWENMLDRGVRGHLTSAWHAAPLLIESGGLLVVTGYAPAGDAAVLGGHLFYDLAMHATTRLVRSLGHDLAPQGATAVGLSPGLTRTEAIVAALGDAPPGSDSIEFPGRAVRALAEDPDVARHAGRMLRVAELADEYGFTDVPLAAAQPDGR